MSTIVKLKKSNKNSILITLRNLFIFYQLEAELDFNIKELQMILNFNTNINSEKIFLLSSYKIPIFK